MLLGLNIYRECGAVNEAYVHYTIYTVSATVGVVIAITAFYNIYAVNYHICNFSDSDFFCGCIYQRSILIRASIISGYGCVV